MSTRFLIIFLAVIALIIFGILLKRKCLKGKLLVSILYLVLGAIIIGAGGLLGNRLWFPISFQLVYLLLCGWMLLVGIGNVFALRQIVFKDTDNTFGTEVLHTFLTSIIGGIIMLLVFILVDFRFHNAINLSSALAFVVPYLFVGIVNRYLNIPIKIFKKWHYPVDEHIEDPTDREMESPLVVAFEFKKKSNDSNHTTFRAKAPQEMVFGKLFYYFINDYNYRNPEEAIEYLDENEKPVDWIFYFKPKLLSKTRYIDPEETNSINLVKENSVIICKRVIEK